MKVILDCNIWISFLIGHQTEVMRHINIRDPKDLYLLSLADSINADYLVSGDTDLLDLEQHHQTKMIKLSEFKSLIQK